MKLSPAKQSFIETWGEMGSNWGISRTMAQVHALLMASDDALSTDDIMLHLRISRGNANMNLRELVSWALVRKVVKLGDRKDYYEAEKDIWKIFCNIVRERKRRELSPLLDAFAQIRQKAEKSAESTQFIHQVKELEAFVGQTNAVMEQISRMENARIVPGVLKALEKLTGR